ncbi:MAG TPA: Holliday junction resolvase RuvX [Candidatus Saccharimonadales bacterium]|nr:Holliday junction resolvase RuvX [Candidatus Saccharimonadales bacterium]
MSANGSILALDIGEKRVGVALTSMAARLPHPLTTMERSNRIFKDIQELIDKHAAMALVVGLPRGLDGQHTAQTGAVEQFVTDLKQIVRIPVYWQDEAVTSRQAEAELLQRGKPYKKGDIDALSATYILEDFVRDNPEVIG